MEDDQTPQWDDLSIDDSLDTLERVQRYGTSNIALQRLVHVKMLTEAAEGVSYEAIHDKLLPLLRVLATDNEWVIRQHLGEQLGGVAAACVSQGGGNESSASPGYRGVLELVLPLVQKLLNDSQEEVRQSTGESLCRICTLLKAEDRGKHALTLVLQLAHDDEQEELRMTAAKLLNDMVESLGPELCHQFVSPELVSLAEDPVFRVRKAAALNMHCACRVAGEPDTTERLLPAYIRLTKDDIYRVRKACAESLVYLSKAMSDDLRSHVLLEVFTRLSADNSKFVRQAALQQLGPFLSTLQPHEISNGLLELFASMAASATGDTTVDNEIRLYCAFNLPGVLHTLGPRRWAPFLREAFQALVRDMHWTIRRTLAFSLHELARMLSQEEAEGGGDMAKGRIQGQSPRRDAEGELVEGMAALTVAEGKTKTEEEDADGAPPPNEDDDDIMQWTGPERVEKELLFAFDYFLRDVEDIRMGVLQSMAKFLATLSPATRHTYLPVLCEMVTRTTAAQWRPRETLAGQIPALLPLFPVEALHTIFSPLCFALLEDPVASVRERTFAAFGSLFDAFGGDDDEDREEGGRDAMLGRLLVMAAADTYLKRQLFVHVALALPSTSQALPRRRYIAQVLPRLVRLAKDPVPVVRISFAGYASLLPQWVVEEEALQDALVGLISDPNEDVRVSMQKCRAQRPDMEPLFARAPPPPPAPPSPRPPSQEEEVPASEETQRTSSSSSHSVVEDIPLLSPPALTTVSSLVDDINATVDPSHIMEILTLATESKAHHEEEDEEEEGTAQEAAELAAPEGLVLPTEGNAKDNEGEGEEGMDSAVDGGGRAAGLTEEEMANTEGS